MPPPGRRGGRSVGRLDRLGEPFLAAVLDRRSLGVVEPRSRDEQRVACALLDLGQVALVVRLRVRAEAIRVEDQEERRPCLPNPRDRPARMLVDLSTSVVSSSSASTPNAAPRAAIDPASSSSIGVDCA